MARRCESILRRRWCIARSCSSRLRAETAKRSACCAPRSESTRDGLGNGSPSWRCSRGPGRDASPACWPPRGLSSVKPSPSGRLRPCRESGNVARDNHLKSPLAVTGEKDRGRGNQNQASRAHTARRSAPAAEAHLAGAAQGSARGSEPLGPKARSGADRERVSFGRPDRRGARPPARRSVHQPEILQLQLRSDPQVARSPVTAFPRAFPRRAGRHAAGLWQLQSETDTKISSAVAQGLKLMSGLDISERRLPQDGRFNVKVRNQQIDVRISSMPTQYGEAVVMRLLHRAGGLQQLSDLGMSPETLERFSSAIHRYTGMVLVTGPTGSGKTTTLYAALNELNKPDCKIITVEDPVEYRLDGLNQVQVNDKIELTFGRVLRSALRQDPDVILIGEMRDLETAEIGLRAAITGHMVLSTLHTRDAASARLRLVDMGVPRYMVAYSLQAVVAQRLLRVNCESCRKPHQPDPREVEWLRSVGRDPAAGRIMAGAGCQHCNGSGYPGRIRIYQILAIAH